MILREVDGRPFIGLATEKITLAREAVWMMSHEPGRAYKCGPFALARIRALDAGQVSLDAAILAAQSTEHGTSLDQIWDLSKELGMRYQMAKRESGSFLPLPSIINWKAGHYAAVIRERGGRFLIQDPTLGNDIWASKEALESETSGYFLIPSGPLPQGWCQVKVEEAKKIWGMGYAGLHDGSGTKPIDDKVKCDAAAPMAHHNFHTQVVSLNIMDTPVGYTPPRGPDMHFTLTYNQREFTGSGNFNRSNFGSKWVCNWVGYVEPGFNDGTKATAFLPGGGWESYDFYYGQPSGLQSGALMTQHLDSTPPYYERTLPDGSRQVFGLNAGGPGVYYLTKVIDPSGQEVQFNYDQGSLRLASVTDALGQSFAISYLSDAPSVLPDYYLITRVEDFAHRAATFEYQNGELWKIHDAIGITSEFHYTPGSDFIDSMTTPYGLTTFSQPVLDADGGVRSIQAIEPDGGIERLEYRHGAVGIANSDDHLPEVPGINFNDGLFANRNSFYWDKKTMAAYPLDANGVPNFTKAKLTQWLHVRFAEN